MSFWKKGQKNSNRSGNSRVNLIAAIIFLLAALIIGKLFYLQVINHGLYYDLAANQHRVYSLLPPERGRIFMQTDDPNPASRLYPIATNKNFYLLFAVPKDVKEAEKISEQLYVFFKQAETEKEADELLNKEEDDRLQAQINSLGELNDDVKRAKAKEIIANQQKLLSDKQYAAARQARREAEILERKTGIINDYLKRLNKPGDVYEPLEQKVDEAVLKKLYLALGPSAENIAPDDLAIENNAMYLINRGDRKSVV